MLTLAEHIIAAMPERIKVSDAAGGVCGGNGRVTGGEEGWRSAVDVVLAKDMLLGDRRRYDLESL